MLGVQTVTLDWHKGAEDNSTPLVGLEGSKWIEAVGTWGGNQLQSLGFKGDNIQVIGHSWGSYVSYEIGAHIPGGVRTLIALDPAADAPILGGGKYKGFYDPNFKFSNVAANSYSLNSSDLANRKYGLTAEYAFDVVAPKNYEHGGTYTTGAAILSALYQYGVEDPMIDKVTDALREHIFAVTILSELLLRQRLNPADPTAQLFTLENLRSDRDEFLKRNGSDGVFYVNPGQYTNDIGKEVGLKTWQAKTFGFRAKDANGNDIINPRTL